MLLPKVIPEFGNLYSEIKEKPTNEDPPQEKDRKE